MDSLEIIIAFNMEFDEQMKVYEVPLTFAEHHADILGQDIRWVFTIGPPVLDMSRVLTNRSGPTLTQLFSHIR